MASENMIGLSSLEVADFIFGIIYIYIKALFSLNVGEEIMGDTSLRSRTFFLSRNLEGW